MDTHEAEQIKRCLEADKGFIAYITGQLGTTLHCDWCSNKSRLDPEYPELPLGWIMRFCHIVAWKTDPYGNMASVGNHIFCSEECYQRATEQCRRAGRI